MRSNVGARGFEPPTSWSQTTRSTKLSYAPASRDSLSWIASSRMRKFGYIATKRGMKIYGLIILSALISIVLIMHGQEAAPPSVDLYENQPTPTPPPPPNGPELPELKQLDQTFKPPSLGTDADATKLRVEWRQLRNRTVNDPEVKAPTPRVLQHLLPAHVRPDYERRDQSSVGSFQGKSSKFVGSAASATFTYTGGRHANTDAVGDART
jgi:hypothetical protein